MHDATLTLIVFGPILLGLTLFFQKRDDRVGILDWALGASIVPLLYSLSLLGYNPGGSAFQFVIQKPFIVVGNDINIQYHMGIDGISLFLVLLTTFITPIAIYSASKAITKNYREFLFMILAMETGILGTFVSLDLILFYIFWEVTLIPMYFIIGVWGSGERVKSALKFVIFTMTGSVLMLVAILSLYAFSSTHTFDVIKLYTDPNIMGLAKNAQMWLFWAFFLAFAIKVPLFPFHTWLPDTHTDAPTAGSVILAALLLKLGSYGLFRFCLPLFPLAAHAVAPLVIVLALIGIIYGAWVATAQTDIKRLVAYSSVSHMGLIVLGTFAFNAGAGTGAVLQMVNHGLNTGALFLMVGMLYDRKHTRLIADYGGIIKVMPIFGAIFWIVTFASIGLPPLNGFIGEFLILFGVFQVGSTGLLVAGALAVTGVIWSAVYMLWMFERVMLGPIRHAENNDLKDLEHREIWLLVPIVILIFAIGIFSPYLTQKIQPSVIRTLDLANRGVVSQAMEQPSMVTPADAPMTPPAGWSGGSSTVIPETSPGLTFDQASGTWVRTPESGGGS